jgi:peptidoglycan/xylan/chitin deacetylase (PgdA/CDA1 family)
MADTGLILMYHRVAEVTSDPWGLCVSPQHFSEQMEVLAKLACHTSLTGLLSSMNDANSRNKIAVTFDDGYADNFYDALPILEKFGVHSTFYVVATALGGEDFWWDQLDSLFLQPGLLPERVSFEQEEQIYQWSLQEMADYTSDHYERWSSWKAWEEPPGKRQFVYSAISRFLKPLNAQQRKVILDQLWMPMTRSSTSRRDHRVLTREELLHLSRSHLVEIGSHTLTHPRLSSLSYEVQKKEIQESKLFFEDLLIIRSKALLIHTAAQMTSHNRQQNW